MADSQDIEKALVSLISGAFYPNGTSSPSTVSALVDPERGWPTEAQVIQAVGQNAVLISVHGDKGMAADRTRYPRTISDTPGTPTITAALSGNVITFSGAVTVGHALAVQSQGVWYPYAVAQGDNAGTIASAFAALIPAATASGAALTLPAAGPDPQVRIVMIGSWSVEVSRQVAVFRISVWAPMPALRDAVFGQLPGIIAYFGDRLTLPDGTIATWMGQSESGPDDLPGRVGEWRRDVLVKYDWPVLYTQAAMPLLLLNVVIEAEFGSMAEFTQVGDVVSEVFALTDSDGTPLTDSFGGLFSSISP